MNAINENKWMILRDYNPLQSPLRSSARDSGTDSAIRLAIGILLQAFKDMWALEKDGLSEESRRERQNEVKEWLHSDDVYPGSLRWVSEILQINVAKFRDWLDLYDHGDESQRKEMIRAIIRLNYSYRR